MTWIVAAEESVDWFARALGLGSLLIAGAGLLFNWSRTRVRVTIDANFMAFNSIGMARQMNVTRITIAAKTGTTAVLDVLLVPTVTKEHPISMNSWVPYPFNLGPEMLPPGYLPNPPRGHVLTAGTAATWDYAATSDGTQFMEVVKRNVMVLLANGKRVTKEIELALN